MQRFVFVLFILILVNKVLTQLKPVAEIKEYQNNNDGNGNYFFRFVTSNGITRQERGRLVNVGQQEEHMVVEGYYSYTDTDGKFKIIYYTADENGYSVQPPSLTTTSVSGPVLASLLSK